MVAQLLRAKANVNAENDYGSTPLHWAAYYGHAAVVAQLLQAKANPTAVNKYGYTPAKTAESRGHSDLAKLLQEAAKRIVTGRCALH